MKFPKNKPEAIVIAPKKEEKLITDIIPERICELCKENGIEVDYAVKEIATEYQIRGIIVSSVMGGRNIYWESTKVRLVSREIPALTFLEVLKAIAEYFSTTTDYILGLTDRPY